ncbi:MAG: DUF58 domain-containing protein [Lachnospiraceae bacterium]|nr:DUF58 domain-containing protein [Lachnospiraceae bacterium]
MQKSVQKSKPKLPMKEQLTRGLTVAGLLIIIAALFFLSTFYRTSLFVFLLILVMTLPVFSYLVGRYSFQKLTVTLTSSTAFSLPGQKVLMKILLQNDSIFPLPDCHVSYTVTSSYYPCDRLFSVVMPSYARETLPIEIPLVFHHIGCYQVRLHDFEIYDYLHLFRFHKKLTNALEIKIYPQDADFPHFEPSSYGEGFDEYEETHQKGNTSSNVTDIREYQPGDRLQKIHWKLSAKIDNLMVKENESTSSNQFTILTELYLPSPTADTLDESLKNAYNLSRSMLSAGQSHFFTYFCAGSSEFESTLITNRDQLEEAFSQCLYQRPYPEEDLGLTTYTRASLAGGIILHASHKGVNDVIS